MIQPLDVIILMTRTSPQNCSLIRVRMAVDQDKSISGATTPTGFFYRFLSRTRKSLFYLLNKYEGLSK